MSFTTATTEAGSYAFDSVQVGRYTLVVELQGFKPAVVKRVKVDTATTTSVNVKLEVGALSDEVTVTAERPLVNTSSGTPGQTITERQIVEMPLNNRSVLDLALTAVNVTGAAGTEDPDLGSEIPTPGMNLFINGGRAGSRRAE